MSNSIHLKHSLNDQNEYNVLMRIHQHQLESFRRNQLSEMIRILLTKKGEEYGSGL